jgi:Tol biopolymer transport system component
MTRRTGGASAKPPGKGDPYGLKPSSSLIAPVASIVGLALIAWISFSLLTGNLPFHIGKPAASGAIAGPARTPTPSNIVEVPSQSPGEQLKGTLVYAKAGNLWVQDAGGARQITSTGGDSMPSLTPDGKILYINTTSKTVSYRRLGGPASRYTATYPTLYEVQLDGSGRTMLTDGLFNSSLGQWFYWLREPVMAPNGRTVALFSDAPNPSNSNVVLQYFDTKTRKLTRAAVPETPPLGQQDAAWSPDGSTLLYVRNGRDGPRGAPQIVRMDWKTKKIRALTGPGYNGPRWSPDGRYIVATKTSTLGTDVVILDARNGNEIQKLTNDGRSWGGAWSPLGDSIAFLSIDGGVTDLYSVKLTGTPGQWTIGNPDALTASAGLDGASPPVWYVPPDQLPPPTPSPPPSSSASPSPRPS